MLKIGLTGGIGSGKTAAAHYFADLGVPIIDADVIAHDVVKKGMPGLAAIVAHFGDEILQADKTLNRAKLRERIFSDKQERIKLESILHPLIRLQIKRQILQAENKGLAPYCLIVIPLMIETKQTDIVDYLTVVDVPVELQIERTMKRDGSSLDVVESIIRSQVDADIRRDRADFIIDNNVSRDELLSKVRELHEVFIGFANRLTHR